MRMRVSQEYSAKGSHESTFATTGSRAILLLLSHFTPFSGLAGPGDTEVSPFLWWRRERSTKSFSFPFPFSSDFLGEEEGLSKPPTAKDRGRYPSSVRQMSLATSKSKPEMISWKKWEIGRRGATFRPQRGNPCEFFVDKLLVRMERHVPIDYRKELEMTCDALLHREDHASVWSKIGNSNVRGNQDKNREGGKDRRILRDIINNIYRWM